MGVSVPALAPSNSPFGRQDLSDEANMSDQALQYGHQPATAVRVGHGSWPVVHTRSTARMLAALRVLTTFYKFGEMASLEDIDNVRKWAGDETLSPTDAAVVVVRRELDGRDSDQCVR